MFSRIIRVVIVAIIGVAISHQAQADTWPARPIRLINALAAGSAPDLLSRIIAERLSTALGQQVVVENRPGAANVIAAQAAARATPDGYTLFFAPSLALIQRAAEPEKRGRVTSVFLVLEESMGMFAALAFAAMALPTKAVQPILLGGSAFMVLVGIGALSALRRRAAVADEQAT